MSQSMSNCKRVSHRLSTGNTDIWTNWNLEGKRIEALHKHLYLKDTAESLRNTHSYTRYPDCAFLATDIFNRNYCSRETSPIITKTNQLD